MNHRKTYQLSAAGIGALAIGAFAVGAFAIGALAIGRLAIGRFAVRKGLLALLEIEDLSVGRLEVKNLAVSGFLKLPAGESRNEAQSR